MCCGVTRGTIRDCLRRTGGNFEAMIESTGAGSGCGSCLGDVQRVFDVFERERRAEREGQLLLPFQAGATLAPSKD